MLETNLGKALDECGLSHNSEEVAFAFRCTDQDEKGSLNREEFQMAAKIPSKLEQWADTLDLSRLLAHALMIRIVSSNDPLRQIGELSSADLWGVVGLFCKGLHKILQSSQQELKKCYNEMDRQIAEVGDVTSAGSKFRTIKMNCGKVVDFHTGLQGRVGAPHPDLTKGMEDEHCEMAGCDEEFESLSYGVKTTPRKEFEVATGRRKCSGRDLLDRSGQCVRVIRRLNILKDLKLVKKAGLVEEEIVSVVLYTGPMYQVYNTILRRYPEDAYKRLHAGGNGFATTIHILVSAVVKIARVMTLPPGLELYRGLGGLAELPDSFYRADEHGRRGFMEWGFLSTTSNKAVAVQVSGCSAWRMLPLDNFASPTLSLTIGSGLLAVLRLEYSGVNEGCPRAMVLRTVTGAIDRGARIADLSQYPGEVQHLLAS